MKTIHIPIITKKLNYHAHNQQLGKESNALQLQSQGLI